MNPKQPPIAVTEPELQQEFTVFTSLLMLAVRNVSRQPSNPCGRKGAPQGALRIQASHRREVRNAILYHQPGWKGCSDISLRGVAADRSQTGGALELQPYEEKVFEPHQLLRPGSGDGRPGTPVDSFLVARFGGDQGRGGRGRQSQVPGSTEHRALQEGNRRKPIHG